MVLVFNVEFQVLVGFPSGLVGKESACNTEVPRLGRSPGEGKDYSLQYSGLENSMDSMGGKESDTTEGLSLSVST